MADNETVAAVLTAGMLRPTSPPATGPDGTIEQCEQTRFVLEVLHAVALYRAVLEALDQTNIRRVRVGNGISAQAERGNASLPEFSNPANAAAAAAPRAAIGANPSVT